MLMKSFVIHCLITSSFAWLAPERCAQNTKIKRNVKISATKSAESVSDINEIGTKQHERLIEAYKNHQFIGVPIQRKCEPLRHTPERFELHAPFNCTFHTYAPRLLTSVSCRRAACKLSYTVSTEDTYSASEGYNWGVKVSGKVTFYKVLEAGGELSVGGTYSCTYTKGKTVSDLVECSDSSGGNGELQLFAVKSDMICEFGQIKFERELRGGQYYGFIPTGSFTEIDMESLQYNELKTSQQTCWGYKFALDSDRLTDRLVEKLKKAHSLYNPLTDLIAVSGGNIIAFYFKKTSFVQDYTRIIPFTKENGDSVYQYACIMNPS